MTTNEREAFEKWVTEVWRPDDGRKLLEKEFPHFAFAAWQARAARAHSNMSDIEDYRTVMLRSMLKMLQDKEWAELFLCDELLAELHVEISKLHGLINQRQEVTDEMVENFVDLVCKWSNEEIDYRDEMTPQIRAALQSIAQPVKVPDVLDPFDSQPEGLNYADGWNACREALLSSSPEDKP